MNYKLYPYHETKPGGIRACNPIIAVTRWNACTELYIFWLCFSTLFINVQIHFSWTMEQNMLYQQPIKASNRNVSKETLLAWLWHDFYSYESKSSALNKWAFSKCSFKLHVKNFLMLMKITKIFEMEDILVILCLGSTVSLILTGTPGVTIMI